MGDKTVLGVLAGLLAGVGLGWIGRAVVDDTAQVARAVERPRVEARGPSDAVADESPVLEGVRTAEVATPGARDATPALSLPTAKLRELARATADAPTAAPEGTATLRGRVVDDRGEPLAGVVVRAAVRTKDRPVGTDPDSLGAAPSDEEDLEEQVSRYAEGLVAERAGRRRTRSAADGSFELVGLPEVTLEVTGRLADWQFERVRGVHHPFGEVELEGKPVRQVPVRVSRADGTVPEHATLVVQAERERHYVWRPDRPYLRVHPGPLDVRAEVRVSNSSSAYGSRLLATSESQVVEVPREGEPPTLEFELAPSTTIVAELPHGTQADYQAVCMPLVGGAEADPAVLARSQNTGRFREGVAQLLDLRPGTYAVGLTSYRGRGEKPAVAVRTVEVEEGENRVRLVPPTEDDGKLLLVRVMDAEGHFVPGCEFRYRRNRGGGSSSGGMRPSSYDDGVYRFDHAEVYDDDDPEEVDLTITVESRRLGEVVQEVPKGAERVEVTFRPAASAVVHVTGDVANLASWTISLAPTGGERWSSEGKSPSSPEVRYERLQPGSYALRANRAGSRRHFLWQSPVELQVEVEPGENVFTIELPTVHDVVVVADAEKAQDATLSPLHAGSWGTGFTGSVKDGRAVIQAVPAGEYVLKVQGLEGLQLVQVPTGDVFFDGVPPQALLVTVVDPEDPWASTGLRTGDRVVGVDGVRFDGDANYGRLFSCEETVMVERGRGSVDVPKPDTEGRGWSAGVRFTPVP